MISALLGTVLVAGLGQARLNVSILDLPDPAAEVVTIHAYLWRDKNYAREEDAWRVISESIGVNSRVYSASEISYFGATAGVQPRIARAPEFVRLELVSTPEKWRETLQLAVSLMAQPNWRSNQWEQREIVLQGELTDPWQWSLWPRQKWSAEGLAEHEARGVHARLVEYSGIRLVVAGPVEIGEAKEEVDRFIRTIEMPEYREISKFSPEVEIPESQDLAISTFELAGKPIRVGEPGAASRFLAAVALGVGKGSAIWRTVREQEGLGYRVEGVFWPTRSGFVPRFILLRKAEQSELRVGGDLISALRSGAQELDIIDFQRAKVMAEQILLRPNAFASIYTDGSGTLFGDDQDDVRWRGLLNGMGLPSLPLARWAELVNDVEFEEFQSAATELVDSGNLRITRGIPGLID